MQMRIVRAHLIAAWLLGCAVALPCSAGDEPTQRYELSNGVRVVSVHVPDASRQAVFCFLPAHLANDGAGQPQWSHLLEHLLIRTTDPESLTPPGLVLNGETMQHSMRLDVIAEPEKWSDAIDRCARWISARTFDRTVLQREKANIAAEERSTSAGGFTGKWAVAAWNQALRHGAAHVPLHASVAAALLEDAQKCAARRLPIDQTILLATIGPADPAELRARIEKSLGALPASHAAQESATVQPLQWQKDLRATWDLPTSHAMIWWKLPDQQPQTLAAATVLASNLMMLMSGGMNPPGPGPRIGVLDHVPTPEGAFFIIDAGYGSAQPELEAVQDQAHDLLEKMAKESGWMVVSGAAMAMQVGTPPDFKGLRAAWPEAQRHMVEGQWLLSRSMLEYLWGQPVEKIVDVFLACDQQCVTALASQLVEQRPGTLVLTPRAEKPAP